VSFILSIDIFPSSFLNLSSSFVLLSSNLNAAKFSLQKLMINNGHNLL
jgi:hypothetical protein